MGSGKGREDVLWLNIGKYSSYRFFIGALKKDFLFGEPDALFTRGRGGSLDNKSEEVPQETRSQHSLLLHSVLGAETTRRNCQDFSGAGRPLFRLAQNPGRERGQGGNSIDFFARLLDRILAPALAR